MTIKLGQLPDRNTVKISFTACPELKSALGDYAEIYSRTYGQKEGVAELIPFMLEAFLNADHGFKRARKQLKDRRVSTPSTQPRKT